MAEKKKKRKYGGKFLCTEALAFCLPSWGVLIAFVDPVSC